ncbi:BRCA1-A complex subunit Abraxas 1 isoform X2 [Pleurodeles waltl]|uniref:BRCA1-A complex subunit Abraxas 1 isoform X2 n=1 Tax=Pleurodeles waltl TaxID=8319 RepID=UPI003709AD7F
MTEGETTSAVVSGFVFGAFAFQHLNSRSDTEGFLLGDVKGEAKNSITDSQMDDVEVVYTIDIQKHHPCDLLFSFYNSAGDIDEKALKKILSGHRKDVIGWYKFRRNSDQTMTFRERLLHKNLEEHLANQGLVFLLLTSSTTTESSSTHKLEYALHKPQCGVCPRISLLVSNLGMSEQHGYRTELGPCLSVGFCKAVKKHRSDFFNEDDTLKEVHKINDMYGTLNEELKKTCIKVEASERSVEGLLIDITRLKLEIAEKKKLRASQASGNQPASPEEEKENVFLCQALRAFFPNSKRLHTCALSLFGRQIPHHCHRTDQNHNLVDKLTLMLEDSDYPEIDVRQSSKRKVSAIQEERKAFKKSRLWQLQRKSKRKTDKEQILALSGPETEEDLSEPLADSQAFPQSPTF